MTCDVRLWHKADIPTRTTTSAFGGEADVPSTDLIDAKRASAPPTRQCASLRRYEPLIREVHMTALDRRTLMAVSVASLSTPTPPCAEESGATEVVIKSLLAPQSL